MIDSVIFCCQFVICVIPRVQNFASPEAEVTGGVFCFSDTSGLDTAMQNVLLGGDVVDIRKPEN